MGNTDSRKKFNKGIVIIKVDHQHVMAGQRVTGNITCKLDEAYPADKLAIELTGKEKVIWEGSDSKHHDPKHSGRITMKHKILTLHQVVAQFSEKRLKKGEHSFPFSFDLPMDLPPSFFFVG
jgi:hypothetical protein